MILFTVVDYLGLVHYVEITVAVESVRVRQNFFVEGDSRSVDLLRGVGNREDESRENGLGFARDFRPAFDRRPHRQTKHTDRIRKAECVVVGHRVLIKYRRFERYKIGSIHRFLVAQKYVAAQHSLVQVFVYSAKSVRRRFALVLQYDAHVGHHQRIAGHSLTGPSVSHEDSRCRIVNVRHVSVRGFQYHLGVLHYPLLPVVNHTCNNFFFTNYIFIRNFSHTSCSIFLSSIVFFQIYTCSC